MKSTVAMQKRNMIVKTNTLLSLENGGKENLRSPQPLKTYDTKNWHCNL